MRKKLSKPQMICLALLWVVLCYLMLMSTPRIDGPVILTVIFSGALVFIPIFKSMK